MVTNKECLRRNDGSNKDSLTKYDGQPTETLNSLYLGLLSMLWVRQSLTKGRDIGIEVFHSYTIGAINCLGISSLVILNGAIK